jgi:uncharacterized protein
LPLIWVLTGAKTGDNAQVLRAANAMGLDFEVRRVALKPKFETAKPRVKATLHHVDLQRSDALAAPWPDVIITIGRRLSLVALWIKEQSGGKTRIALFNAPKGQTGQFDLMVVPEYYKFPSSPNVCRIGLPLIAADPERIAAGKAQFAGTIGAMPKPLHVLLLGGGTRHMRLDAEVACDILHRMRAGFAQTGSIFVSTSRRTSPAAADALAARLRPGDRIFRWRPDAADNPMPGLLAHGDTFTVTGDSISMITEIARLGRPLAIAELPPRRSWIATLLRIGDSQLRDFDGLHRYLRDGGYAVRLGEPLLPPIGTPPDDTVRVALRLRQLAMAGQPAASD